MKARLAALLLLLESAAAADGRTAEPLGSLLRELAGEGAARIRVEGWIERDEGSRALAVRLVPEGGARLVADPGVQLVPLPGPDGRWAASEAIWLVDSGRSYFEEPVEIRLPVAEGATGSAEAEVAYGWCVVERICLFGTATVSVPLEASDG